jgi:uncharacterized protein (TIGR02598 family)
VALALGVAGFCLIAILGLLPTGLKTNQASTRQTTANGIQCSIVADLRATPEDSATSNQFGINLQGTTTLYFDGNGKVVQAGDPGAIFFATVTFPSSGGQGRPAVPGEAPNGESKNTAGSSLSGKGGGPGPDCFRHGGGGGGSGGGGGGGGSGGTPRTATFASTTVGWPAAAGSGQFAPAGSIKAFVGLDRN